MNETEQLAQQYKYMFPHGELRIMRGVYAPRLVYRSQMGQLMGGDRSQESIQAKWDSLEVYAPLTNPSIKEQL